MEGECHAPIDGKSFFHPRRERGERERENLSDESLCRPWIGGFGNDRGNSGRAAATEKRTNERTNDKRSTMEFTSSRRYDTNFPRLMAMGNVLVDIKREKKKKKKKKKRKGEDLNFISTSLPPSSPTKFSRLANLMSTCSPGNGNMFI